MEMGVVGILKFVAALGFVLALMGGFALVLKKTGIGQGTLAGRGGKRLKLVEILPLDARHKAVILQCDTAEHLLVLGPAGDMVVESNIADTKRSVSRETKINDAA
jgi:flagellar protein FliO/FliZ